MTVVRLTDPVRLQARVSQPDMRPYAQGFDAAIWLSTPGNVALDLNGNIMLFEPAEPGIYSGHWLLVERGKKAFLVAIDLLRHLFEHYEARTVQGLVPASHRVSRWFTRQIGFKSSGLVNTEEGAHEFFSMSRQEFEARYGFSEIEKPTDQSSKRLGQ